MNVYPIALILFVAAFMWYENDSTSVSVYEAREYLQSRLDFATYRLMGPAICTKNKTGSDLWGEQFEGVNFDGSTFKAVVCPLSQAETHMRVIPNQPDDPLDVVPNYEYLMFPPAAYTIIRITKP